MLARGECSLLGGGKAGIEQKPYFQVQNASGFLIWPLWLLPSKGNELLKETFPWFSDFGQGLPWSNVRAESPMLQVRWSKCVYAANKPGILHVKQLWLERF